MDKRLSLSLALGGIGAAGVAAAIACGSSDFTPPADQDAAPDTATGEDGGPPPSDVFVVPDAPPRSPSDARNRRPPIPRRSATTAACS